MIGLIIVTTLVLICLTPLAVAEGILPPVEPIKWPKVKVSMPLFLVNYWTRRQEAKKILDAHFKEKEKGDRRRTLAKKIEKAVPNRFVGDYGSTMTIYCSPKDLHACRQGLRRIFGHWSDSLDRTEVSYGGEYLEALYKGATEIEGFSVRIEVNYDINNLPAGLLKPGCRITEEVNVRKFVVCE